MKILRLIIYLASNKMICVVNMIIFLMLFVNMNNAQYTQSFMNDNCSAENNVITQHFEELENVAIAQDRIIKEIFGLYEELQVKFDDIKSLMEQNDLQISELEVGDCMHFAFVY